jgi:PTH1 family peptidyl-tRNA hydrolase
MKQLEKNEDSDIKLVFFCGNPGKEYAKTRHNAAWLVLEELKKTKNLTWQKKFKGFFCRYPLQINSKEVIFLKPDIFMNLAGESVSPALSFFKLKPCDLLVCHDDIELDFGTVSFKFSGGSAGHNGLRSIAKFCDNNFYRLRVGISYPQRGGVDSYVLGKFSKDEEIILPLYMERAAALLEEFISNSTNGKNNFLSKKIKVME